MNDDDDSCRDSDNDHCDCSGDSYSDEFEFQEKDHNTGTMNPQTFQNYVSALKWWVRYENPNYRKEPSIFYRKEPSIFSEELDSTLEAFVKSYKRDAKKKEGRGTPKKRA